MRALTGSPPTRYKWLVSRGASPRSSGARRGPQLLLQGEDCGGGSRWALGSSAPTDVRGQPLSR